MNRSLGGTAALALAVACVLCACDGGRSEPDADATADVIADSAARWQCPPEWVPAARGGCGPAVLLCATNGGAAEGACAMLPFDRPHAVTARDGDAGAGLYLAPGGALAGPWPELGSPGGPPARDAREPTVGIPAASCPPGWTPGTEHTCDPTLSTTCGPGSFPMPGGRCARTGESACPASTFPAVPPESTGARVTYVRAGATGAGSSAVDAVGTITAGIAAAGPGGWVLVAAGHYDEDLAVSGDNHVLGLCAARVSITGRAVAGTVHVAAGGQLDLRDVTVTAGAGPGVSAISSTLRLERVRVEGALGAGVLATGAAEVRAIELVVRHTRVEATGRGGYGVSADTRAWLDIRGGSFENNRAASVSFVSRGQLLLDDVAVRGSSASVGDQRTGVGVIVAGTARAVIHRLAMEGLHGEGLWVVNPETSVTAEDVVVRGSVVNPTTDGVTGVSVDGGATLVLRRALLERIVGYGAQSFASRLEMHDSVVRDIFVSAPRGLLGYGIDATMGATIVTRNVLITRAAGAAVRVRAARTTADLQDSVLRDTVLRRSDGASIGLLVMDRAAAVARRLLLEGNLLGGARSDAREIPGNVTTLEIEDSVVRGNGAGPIGGRGVEALAGGTLRATRVLFDRNTEVSVSSQDDQSLVVLEDCAVIGGASRADGMIAAVGVFARLGGAVRARRTRIEGNAEAGAGASGQGASGTNARLTLTECLVRESSPTADGRAGIGIAADESGEVELERVVIDDHQWLGVIFADSARATMSDVIVRGVRPSIAGLGVGLMVLRGATAIADRLAVADTSGAAIVAIPLELGVDFPAAPAAFSAADLYVRATRPGTVSLRADAQRRAIRDGRAVSYGLHATRTCSLEVTRGLIDGGGYGFYAASGSRLTLRQVLVLGQTEAAGANDGATLELEGLVAFGNSDDTVQSVAGLPESAIVPLPSPLCPDTGCE